MKTIGLIGGLSWESTSEYYRIINETINKELGKLHSAKIVLYSFDFEEIVQLQHDGKWDIATEKMVDAGKLLQTAGADMAVICTNTMHMMANDMKKTLDIPLLHIVDTVAEEIKEKGFRKVALLGTKFTMEHPFYRTLLIEKGIDVIVPEEEDRQTVHDVIYHELCKGITTNEAKDKYLSIIHRLQSEGAEGIILGCTEIPLLIKQEDTPIPLLDSTYLHAKAAAKLALQS